MQDQENYTFKFLSYYLNRENLTATFCYQGIDGCIFTEKIIFDKNPDKGKEFNVMHDPELDELLDRALFLAYVLSGTSYYKAHPTPFVRLEVPIDDFQAAFFSRVYQEGLSQFAFENHLVRNNLAHFYPTPGHTAKPALPADHYKGSGTISLQSGGKDSLLVSELLHEADVDYTPWYVSSSDEKAHPAVIDNLFDSFNHSNASICVRKLDLENLHKSGGMNGHVPVTFILESLALVQAILNNDDTVLASIGQEGEEPHSMIGDLPVNHQWSKTWEAEQLMTQYINTYISPALHVGSPIRYMSELRIAGTFVEKCWVKYGYQFSSCNRANYTQKKDNKTLDWCGECAKCANSYLLFCPFLAPQQLQTLFNDRDLFANPNLTETFKGLLGVEGQQKPFECVGSIDELRTAYQMRMKVGPVPVEDLPASLRAKLSLNPDIDVDLIDDDAVKAVTQASDRLGLSKLFRFRPKPKKTATVPTEKVVKVYQPVYANLPFKVPEGHFDYKKDFPCDPFFKDFMKTHEGTFTKKKKAAQDEAAEAERRAAERAEREDEYRAQYGIRQRKRK